MLALIFIIGFLAICCGNTLPQTDNDSVVLRISGMCMVALAAFLYFNCNV